MNDLYFFLKGLAIGMAMAAPVGPIGILTIRRALSSGMLAAFIGGIGAALADGVFGTLAAFGHAAVSGFLETHIAPLRIVGGLFLLLLAVRTFRSHLETEAGAAGAKESFSLKRAAVDLVSTFFLTVTNPATIFAFMVVFAAVGVDPEEMGRQAPAVMIVAGVFAGSLAWWGILSLGVGLFRKRARGALRVVNAVSALVLALFGAAVLGWQGFLFMKG